MPRRKGFKARLTPVHEEQIIPQLVVPLTMEERGEFRKILETPLMRRVWNNARAAKPSEFAGDLNLKRGKRIANNRLHEMRGWRMFEVAIFKQVYDPKPVANAPKETYPDSGLPGK